MKLVSSQRGQTTILVAVSILLIVFIGMSVFVLGDVFASKTRFRNMSDSIAFAGGSVQQLSMEGFQNIANLEPLLKISYNLGLAMENLMDGAKAVHRVAPGYDPTADIFNNDMNSIMGSYDSLIKQIASNPISPHFVDADIYNEMLNFYMSDAMIYAKTIEQRNLTLNTNRWANYYSLICPAEAILQRGPINGVSGTAPRFKWEIGLKNGKLVFRYVRRSGGNVEDATSGVFNILVSDSPTLRYRVLPVSTSLKQKKILAYSYAYPVTDVPDNVTYDPINLAFIELEFINLINIIRAALMKNNNNASSVKNMWNDMVDDYNSFNTFLDSNRFKAAFGINDNIYKSNPVMGGLPSMKLLNLTEFKTICSSKGLSYSSASGQDTFYKTLTLKDIFSTTTNFRSALETSIDRLAADRANLSSDLTTLLNTIRNFDINRASGNNIPSKLLSISQTVYETLNSSTLAPFLQVTDLVGNAINGSYKTVSDTKALITLRNSYNFNNLKPPQAFWTLVPYFFEIPIVQMEGT